MMTDMMTDMMTEYRLSDLLDFSIIKRLADANFRASGVPMSIIDVYDGSILVQAGWTELCINFHRANPNSNKRCVESDTAIVGCLAAGDAHRYKCKNGLWHIALPIVVAGKHMATMFLGQFLFEGEVPDREYFIHQGREFGYELDAYLAALDKMRVFSREQVDYIIAYDKAIVLFISDLAEQSIGMIAARKSLVESENKYRSLVANINIGVFRNTLKDAVRIQANPAMAKIFGYDTLEEFMATRPTVEYQSPQDRERLIEKVRSDGFVQNMELPMCRKDGKPIWCSCTATAQYDENGEIMWMDGVIEDITMRKQAEESQRKAHDELEMRVKERTADLVKVNEQMLVEIAERKRIEEKLRELSEKDPLTKIYNRRKLSELLEIMIKNEKRYARTLSLILFDLDHFKAVNDSYGHDEGDVVLKATADIVNGIVREADIFARYGGEEFVVVSPGTGIQGAVVLAEKLRRALEEHAHPNAGKVTISVGVAEFTRNDSESTLIKRADEALYKAKNNGRNRVEVARLL
jgi:diguanylate cyclase (GGDEF)-like protein/PAS domain S-box-containing protein